MVEFEKALLDPGLAFKTPEEVLKRNDLSRDQKIKILRQWEYDVREMQVADDENMTGPQPVAIGAIRDALRSLGILPDTEKTAPTKQGGS
ncbi:MAG TPA: hypothetical protein VE616_05025 [Candidatus Udaeobacter sp.]|jgi:hypothetical protein|nr:hypothetical protein [Candidatus Udaeobacter sp.]